jgi:anti-sigma factor RsiW
MSECGLLSDRIPAVMMGQAIWTAEEARHLEECPACRQEWSLLHSASHLGQSVQHQIDVEGLAASLLQRMRRERQERLLRRRTWTVGGLAAAAGLLVALWTGGLDLRTGTSPATGSLASGSLGIPLPELDSLQPAELDSVLRAMDAPDVGSLTAEDLDIRDLNSDELERVLDSWEG